jgi:hypothetical protein
VGRGDRLSLPCQAAARGRARRCADPYDAPGRHRRRLEPRSVSCAPAWPAAFLVRGTFLRTADLRSQPAYTSMVVRRSTMPRRVVPTPPPGHHQTRAHTRRTSEHLEASRAVRAAAPCPETMPSTRQNGPLTSRSTSILQPVRPEIRR